MMGDFMSDRVVGFAGHCLRNALRRRPDAGASSTPVLPALGEHNPSNPGSPSRPLLATVNEMKAATTLGNSTTVENASNSPCSLLGDFRLSTSTSSALQIDA